MNQIEKLAKTLVNHSCKVQKGEKVQINMLGSAPMALCKQLVKEVYQVGGLPFVHMRDNGITREILLNASDEQLNLWAESDKAMMEQMDCYIGVSAPSNPNEFSDVPEENLKKYSTLYTNPVHMETRLPKTRWVVLRFPNEAMAAMSGKSTEAFNKFFYDVCTMDYKKMSQAMDPLEALMLKTDRVHITGPGTDLRFSIKGIPVVKCAGDRNIPDGEIYTAPVKDSVNGVLTYNTPSEYQGTTYENITLTFANGKIIDSTTPSTQNDVKKLCAVFDTDPGARYVGEFALGVNPYITKPMKDTLFDEKITGSFHFTPGNSYDSAPNGNSSAIHWDLVCIQTPEFGGGEIYFDDILVRKDGLFVHPDLLGLNPSELLS